MMCQGFRFDILKAILFVILGITFLCSVGFGLLLPSVGNFTGGEVSTTGSTGTWVNNCGETIHDCLIKGFDDNDEEIPSANLDIGVSVDGDSQDWSVIDNYNGTDWKKMYATTTAGDCLESQQIKVESNTPVARLEIWFTNKYGHMIHDYSDVAQVTANDMLTIPALDAALNNRWSNCMTNKTNFLITGYQFIEVPEPLTMVQLSSSRLGTTDIVTKIVTFEFPLEPMSGRAVVGAKYSSPPTADTTVRCLPIVSKVLPESADARQAFQAGTSVSVPNLTITEAEVGAIQATSGKTEIVLKPRNPFSFVSVESLTVQSGNILLGTPFIENGEIHIAILAPSYGEGKSSILLSGIKIDTTTEITEGTVSVRLIEPTGNSSNFHYAYYAPEE